MFCNFNTSHVSINHRVVVVMHLEPFISIHLMFLLIETKRLCRGLNREISIHLTRCQNGVSVDGDFNTSHVSINRTLQSYCTGSEKDFNTSHVSINRRRVCVYRVCTEISIHLMFLLIGIGYDGKIVRKLFQYISCFY